MLHQILMEANEHSDMLLGNHKEWQDSFYPWHVFQVQDSYYTLVEKTLTFMEFAVRTYPNFRYLVSTKFINPFIKYGCMFFMCNH